MKLLITVLSFLVIMGCSGGREDKSGGGELSRSERDSVLSESAVPGAGAVGRALEAADSASARTKKLNKFTE